MRWMFGLLAAMAFHTSVMAEEQDHASAPPVQVMVLGTYHWANPGRDVANVTVDDVLSDRRQAEIAELADTLSRWEPTKIAVESVEHAPDFVVPDFAEVDTLLKTQRNESIQLGYRLADMLGHNAVYGIDEQGDDGEPDYFPFGAVQEFAEANGQAQITEQVMAIAQAAAQESERDLAAQTIAESLIPHNRADELDARHDQLYYSMLRVGDGDSQPGAELNAYWYMRNAQMFAKLDMVAEPGDRILLIVGSGHTTWLRHFVRRMPGYELVDALPFLHAAEGGRADPR
ncbi:DUF5694 domain-containing protein [Aurantiacibacter poecillastricola]|uniref:DUF5694 domain-containing protein n=1 Tax=Aurantiacibacter poecillastricola TaxID=3064385 RepID=UPI00273F6969|nr:DUF5694 domain-containing protein [Aurantiacibacter sp. 219JJ12-13]MDP5262253.1 DUF5694 domain-containing protein [Aurantiacibacter sp. 219JJ12-13]